MPSVRSGNLTALCFAKLFVGIWQSTFQSASGRVAHQVDFHAFIFGISPLVRGSKRLFREKAGMEINTTNQPPNTPHGNGPGGSRIGIYLANALIALFLLCFCLGLVSQSPAAYMQAPPASFVLGKSPRLWLLTLVSATLCLLVVFVRVRRVEFLRSVGKMSGRVLLTLAITVVMYEAAGFMLARHLPITLLGNVPDWVKGVLPESAFERADFRMLGLSEKLNDQRFGNVMAPNKNIEVRLSEIKSRHITDSFGFSNADDTLYTHADIVTIGDSFTQAVLVDYQLSWPRQLADLTGNRVLNLGVPGYGIGQYKLILEQVGVRARPKTIIVGLYNNDLEPYFYNFQDYLLTHPSISGIYEYMRLAEGNQTYQTWQYPDPMYPNWLSVVSRNMLVPIGWVLPFSAATFEFVTEEAAVQLSDDAVQFNLNGKRIRMKDYNPFFPRPQPIASEPVRLRQDFEAIVRLAAASGSKIHLVYIPIGAEVYGPLLREATDLNARAQNAAAAISLTGCGCSDEYARMVALASLTNTPLYDATPYLQEKARVGEQLYLVSDGHFSPSGNARFAEFVQSIMTEQGAAQALRNNRMP